MNTSSPIHPLRSLWPVLASQGGRSHVHSSAYILDPSAGVSFITYTEYLFPPVGEK